MIIANVFFKSENKLQLDPTKDKDFPIDIHCKNRLLWQRHVYRHDVAKVIDFYNKVLCKLNIHNKSPSSLKMFFFFRIFTLVSGFIHLCAFYFDENTYRVNFCDFSGWGNINRNIYPSRGCQISYYRF